MSITSRAASPLLLVALALLAATPPLAAQFTERVSISQYASQGNNASLNASVSVDGSYVAFASSASNLVPNDNNSRVDVFLHDRLIDQTSLVSSTYLGGFADNHSSNPRISDTGQYIAFESDASNIVSSDGNGRRDVFLHDRQSGTNTLVSVSSNGDQANDHCFLSSISGDGRLIVFHSNASNLTSNDTNGVQDVFVRDRLTATTIRVSVNSGGLQANGHSSDGAISSAGRHIAFSSVATNLVAGDVNGASDVFVRDLAAGTTTAITIDPNSLIGNNSSFAPDLNNDGRYVCFQSWASNLVAGDSNNVADIFVYDRQNATFERVSKDSFGQEGNQASQGAALSNDGTRVAFYSASTNLVPGDTNGTSDVFLRDRTAGSTSRVSVSSAGVQGNGSSASPSISGDGRYVGFGSSASNLVSNDTNNVADVFVHHHPPCSSESTYCTAKVNSQGCAPVICSLGSPTMSGADDFHIQAYGVLNIKSGLMFWGRLPASIPFYGGTLCVRPPVVRTVVQNSGGSTTTSDCTGMYSFHFSQAYMAFQQIQLGETLYAQYWSRDPFLAPPNNYGLTDGLQFTVEP